MERYIFFRVTTHIGQAANFVWARDREHAKREAFDWLGGNPDQYIVEPLTERGQSVRIEATLVA